MAPPFSADRRRLWPALALLLAAPASALEALDDDALATVRAQDGLTLDIGSPNAISVSEMLWHTDNGASTACTSGGTANRHACTLLAPRLAGSGGNLAASLTLDVGSNGSNVPGVNLALDWQPLLLSSNRLTLRTPTADYGSRTLGQLGIHSEGHFHLRNTRGLFNAAAGNLAQFDFTSEGDMVYRQGGAGSPEISFGNFELSYRSTTGAAGGQTAGPGRFGIDSQGIVTSAPFMDMDLFFDLMYKAAPTNFDTTGRSPIIQFGWSGGLRNAELRLAAGGIGYGTYTSGGNTWFDLDGSHGGDTRSEGLNLYAAWDFDSDFAWILGQAGGNRTQARFTNWRRLGNAPGPMLAMPLILDVLQNNVGPGGTGSNGLCFGNFTSGSPVQASCTAAGGSWVPSNVAAGNAAMAVLLRDAHVHAYNQQVEVVDPSSPNPTQLYDWSLLYTYGKLDADIFLYPQGRNPGVAVSTNNSGMKADITLAIQSPGYWDQANCTLSTSATQCLAGVGATAANAKAVRDALYTSGAGTRWATNTHFMVADTNVGGTGQQYGVGIVNADLLWRVRDLFFRVVTSDSGYPVLPGGLWMQTDSAASYRFRGLFGGGNLLDLSQPSGIALLDVNLSTNRFIFALHPRTPIAGDAPVGFSGLLDLDGTAFLSLGEISQPSSAYRIYDVGGRIGWLNGNVNLVSGQNTLDSLPRLSISNDLLIGNSANFGDGPGAPLIGKVGFGSENFGRIALPGGTWNSNVTLRIPGI